MTFNLSESLASDYLFSVYDYFRHLQHQEYLHQAISNWSTLLQSPTFLLMQASQNEVVRFYRKENSTICRLRMSLVLKNIFLSNKTIRKKLRADVKTKSNSNDKFRRPTVRTLIRKIVVEHDRFIVVVCYLMWAVSGNDNQCWILISLIYYVKSARTSTFHFI